MNRLTANSLSKEKASQHANKIDGGVWPIRVAIYEMWCHQGYKVLGYDTWEEFLETLSINPLWVSRQCAAAIVEVNLGLEVASLPEEVLRPLVELSAYDQQYVWKRSCKKFNTRHRDEKLDIPTANFAELIDLTKAIKEQKKKLNNRPDGEAVVGKIIDDVIGLPNSDFLMFKEQFCMVFSKEIIEKRDY